MLLYSEVQLCGVLGAAVWGFRCSCVGFSVQLCGVLGAAVSDFRCRCRVLGAGEAVWGFRCRCSCVAF